MAGARKQAPGVAGSPGYGLVSQQNGKVEVLVREWAVAKRGKLAGPQLPDGDFEGLASEEGGGSDPARAP